MNVAPTNGTTFSWVPIYAELAKKILAYRNRQADLINILNELQGKGVSVISTTDRDKNGKKIPLTEIDPFTFFASFNRNAKEENRRSILAHLKTKLGLQSALPTDFDGIPIAMSLAAWFFAYKEKRDPDDVPSLWKLADAVVQGSPEKLDPKLYERCLQIAQIGRAKLTMGMYWLNPQQYVAYDANNRKLFEQKGINSDIDTLSGYLQLVKEVDAKIGTNYLQISRRAWKLNKGEGVSFEITPAQMEKLWGRFHERISDFTDFESPGDAFRKQELDYKRSALKRYREEIGNDHMRKWIEAGDGNKAREGISKRIQANLVAYQAWRVSLGSNDKQSSAVLKVYLDTVKDPYAGPSSIEPIIQATVAQGLKPSWDTLSTVLWAMRPSDFFPIKISYYRKLAEELGQVLPDGPPTADKFDQVMTFGRAFWDALVPLKPQDWVDVQSFIWVVCPKTVKGEKQYWAGGHLYGKGSEEEESKLDEFMQGNCWKIGWERDDPSPAAKKTWAYFEQIRVGDELAIKGFGGRNDLRIYYIGEVIDKNEEVLKLRKLNRDLYRGKGPSGLSGATWFETLVPITSKPIIDAIFYREEASPDGPEEEPGTSDTYSGAKNLILYGPPGTGKTYQTVERALEAIDPRFLSKHLGDRVALKRRFDDLALQGRIEFITFHQSYSYEDFVEGIRPVLDAAEEGGSPRYECRPGAFKRLAFNALFDCLERAEAAKDLVLFDALWKALLSKIESDPEAKYPGLSEKTSYEFAVTQRGNLEGTNVLSNKTFLCSRRLVEQVFDAKRNQDSVSVSEVMEVAARGCHSQLVAAVFNELRRIEKSQFQGKVQSSEETVRSDSDRAEVVQRFLAESEKSGYQLKPLSLWNRYVLVIDEINRGNISKILGELITLLEPDKRLGAQDKRNSLIVTLPYSGEKFAVPANLDVVATMNTADKSIALVDVALRRRFDFEEVRVDLHLCDGLTTEMRNAVEELNLRIALRKDRDHQVGHAYFISVTDEASFNQRFRRQIIPLLQEYFYNDWEGLRYVLGENSTTVGDGGFIRKVGGDIKEARTKWRWFFDAGADDVNCLQRLCGNYQIA